MTDIVEKLRHQQRAAEDAEEIAGHDETRRDLGEAGLGCFGAEKNDL